MLTLESYEIKGDQLKSFAYALQFFGLVMLQMIKWKFNSGGSDFNPPVLTKDLLD